jgi:hypothetical protein
MLKKYWITDIIFFVTCIIFTGISIYELIKIIIPLYTYPRAITIFLIIFTVYILCIYISKLKKPKLTNKITLFLKGFYVLSKRYLNYIVFFDYSSLLVALSRFVFQKFLRPYSVAMTILIVWLGGYLAVKNNLIEQIGEWGAIISQTDIVQEYVEIPGIMSWEATLSEGSEEDAPIEYENVLVSSRYNIEPGLELWSSGESVELLQRVLWNLQYFLWDVNWSFQEDTQLALIEALKNECNWPESTSWIFWPQAKECIDNLEMSRVKQVPLQEEIITN